MADNLPEPKSRKESYLAKAAGMDVTIPEAPESRTEQYLAAIAEGGGGGGTSDFDELTNRPKYNGTTMTSSTDIPASPTVVQTTGTSETDVMSQKAVTDTLFNSNNKSRIQIGSSASSTGGSYFGSIAIGANTSATGGQTIAMGQLSQAKGFAGIAIGNNSDSRADGSIAIGYTASATWNGSVAIGGYNGTNNRAQCNANGSIALGMGSQASSVGEMNIGDRTSTYGYNNTAYRLLTGLYDGQSAHDAATVGQAVGTTESYTIATGDWTALSASSPYTYQATVTATYTIGNDTTVELINDAPVTFGNYGFAIGSVSGQNVTIYSIGQPSASVTLKVNYKG